MIRSRLAGSESIAKVLPMCLSPEQTLDALKWRYATKQFDPDRTIPEDTWKVIEESLVLTPSSFGLQPWKFIVVQDEVIRELLFAESWQQAQVTDASHFVVLTVRTDLTMADIERWMECSAQAHGKSVEDLKGLKGMIAGFADHQTPEQRLEWNTRQSYIALGQLMAVAAVMGIDACPMEGINPKAYNTLLELEDTGYTTVVACALGYRSDSDKYATTPKARYPLNEVVQYI